MKTGGPRSVERLTCVWQISDNQTDLVHRKLRGLKNLGLSDNHFC